MSKFKNILLSLFVLAGCSLFAQTQTGTTNIMDVDTAANLGGAKSKGSCRNYKTRKRCKICKDSSGAFYIVECANNEETTKDHDSKTSFIDNWTFNYIHTAYDYRDDSASQISGCGSCGSSSPSRGLIPLSFNRIHRFRNTLEQSSFGGGVFSSWDITLSLFKSGNKNRIDISDPNDLNTRRLFPVKGIFRDTFASSYDGLTLYKEDGNTTTDILLADTAILKTKMGKLVKFEIFSFDDVTKMGRLKEIEDRNGYKHTINYEIDDYRTVDPQVDPLAKFRFEAISGPTNRTLTFTYLQEGGLFVKRKGAFVIKSMTLPNGSAITYNYGSTTDSGLESVNYPDGTNSTFTVDQSHGRTRVHFFEAGQKGFDRNKSAYLTNNFTGSTTNDGLQYYNSASLLVDFVTKGDKNTTENPNNEEVAYIGMVDGHIMHRKVYDGGGKLKWLDIDVTRFYENWNVSGDPTNGAAAISGSRESKYTYGPWRNYTGNRQGRPPVTYNAQGIKHTYVYNHKTSKTRQNYPDGTYETWAYNEFEQPIRTRDRLGRVTLNHYDSRGNQQVTIVGIQATALPPGSERLSGLFYNMYEGTWNQLPDFSALTPLDFGVIPNVEIDMTDRTNRYGMTYEGDILIDNAGDYVFTSGSDDGSRVYINGQLVVDNDGLHGLVEVDSAPITLSAGYHSIRIEYFEKGGGQKLFVYYNGPDTNNEKMLIPDQAFSHMANGISEVDMTTPETAVIVKQYYPAGANQHLLRYEYDAWEFPANGDFNDVQGLIDYVVANNTKRKEYLYNADNQLEHIIEPDDDLNGQYHTAWSFSYDNAKRLQSSTDAGSTFLKDAAADPFRRTTHYFYDSRDRLTTIEYHDLSTEINEYGQGKDANLIVKRTDRNGNQTKLNYDALGRLDNSIEAFGTNIESTTQYSYLNGTDKILSMTVNGNRTEYGYDYRHRRVQTSVIADDDSTLTTSSTYIDNLLFCQEDPYGRKTYYLYRDSDSAMTKTVQGTVPSYTLNSFNDVFNAQRFVGLNATHIITEYEKDVEGQPIEVKDGKGIRHTTKYNSRGWPTESIQAADTLAAKTETDYDAYGNRVEVRHPRYFDENDLEGEGQCSTSFTYTRRNKQQSMTGASSSSLSATMSYTWYNDGKKASTTDFRNNTSTTVWHNCCGRLQANIDPLQNKGISNNDYHGNVTHTAAVDSSVAVTDYHDLPDGALLNETTTLFDARHRPVARTLWLQTPGDVDPNAVPIATDPALGLTSTTVYYDELNGHPELTPLLSKLSITFTGNTGSAIADINPQGEVSLTIMDGAGRVVAEGMIDKDTWEIGTAGTLVTWNTILHDNISTDPATAGLLITESKSALGHINKSFSDGAGRVLKTLDAKLKASTAQYDANNNVVISRDANGTGLNYIYDDLNRQVEYEDREGSIYKTEYNLHRQVVKSTDPKNKFSSQSFDARGRMVSQTNREDKTRYIAYDANSNVIATWDENQEANVFSNYLVATRYIYDERNLQTVKALPGHPVGDETDNYIDLSTAVGHVDFDRTHCSYDGLRRQKVCTDQEGDNITYIYDLVGRMTDREYRNHNETDTESVDEFKYDFASRPLSAYKKRYNNSVIFTYDNIGRKQTETVKLGEVNDQDPNIQSFTTTCGYDDDSREDNCLYPSGKLLERGIDSRNQLTSLTFNNVSIIDEITYDDGMREKTRKFANGLKATHDYYLDNTKQSISVDLNGTVQQNLSFSYTYDANKNVESETTTGALTSGYSWNATFDDLDRVENWNRTNSDSQTWDLDPLGNWLTTSGQFVGAAFSEDRTNEHDDVNQLLGRTLLGQPKDNFSYDAKGNLTSDEHSGSLAWDNDNHLQSYLGGNDVSFEYDALGRRLKKNVTGEDSTLFINHGHRVIEEYTFTGGLYTLARSYVHASYIDDIAAKVEASGETHFYHGDRQYNVRGLTNNNANILELYAYTVYGKQEIINPVTQAVESESLYENKYGFTGRYHDDETGLWYFRARYFSDELGRFINRDPLGYVDGMSLYNGYFAQHFGMDPFGLDWRDNQRRRASNKNPSRDGIAFVALVDSCGCIVEWIPVVGDVVDVGKTIYYVYKRDWKNAAISGASIVLPNAAAKGAGKLWSKYGHKAIEVTAEAATKIKALKKVDPEDVKCQRIIGKAEVSHDMGVNIGRKYAVEKLDLQDAKFVNPREFRGKYGQGFDDVRIDSDGTYYIVEYKGGSAKLAEGQMGKEWVDNNIEKLIKDKSPWGPILMQAKEQGKLKGVTISVPSPKGVGDVQFHDY